MTDFKQIAALVRNADAEIPWRDEIVAALLTADEMRETVKTAVVEREHWKTQFYAAVDAKLAQQERAEQAEAERDRLRAGIESFHADLDAAMRANEEAWTWAMNEMDEKQNALFSRAISHLEAFKRVT